MPVPEITVDELAELIGSSGSALALIDVREPDEYVDAHVAGARLIPLATVPDRIDELKAIGPVVVICAMGGRSRKACEFLESNGISATNVAGGTKGWIQTGRPVITGDQPG